MRIVLNIHTIWNQGWRFPRLVWTECNNVSWANDSNFWPFRKTNLACTFQKLHTLVFYNCWTRPAMFASSDEVHNITLENESSKPTARYAQLEHTSREFQLPSCDNQPSSFQQNKVGSFAHSPISYPGYPEEIQIWQARITIVQSSQATKDDNHPIHYAHHRCESLFLS
jgi:hypothetical protein